MGRRKTKRRDSLSSSFPSPPALSLTALLSRRLRDDKQGRVSLLPHSLTRHLHISHNAPCFPPPKFCMTFFFSFLLGIAAVLREFENNTYANFWGANKVHYGRCASGVLAGHSLRC